jgi:hypothetical protein
MIPLLAFLFLFFTAASGVLGLLAQTWAKDKPNLADRLRWTSIGCIVPVFIISFLKENLNSELQGNLQGKIDAQSKEISHLRTELKDANATILDTRTKLLEGQLAAKKTAEGIQEHVYQRLYRESYGFMALISSILEEASDGWLPANESEFFSRRSISMFCRELNTDGPARVSPPQHWSTWFPRRMQEYKTTLTELIKAHSPQLDPALLNAMSKVERSHTFAFIPQMQRARQTDKSKPISDYPPLFCYGTGFVDMVLKDFEDLSTLYSQAVKGAKTFGIRTAPFPLPQRNAALGRNRFSPEQLANWQKEHKIPVQ